MENLLSFLPLFIFAEISYFLAEELSINDSENGLKSHEGLVAGHKAWGSTIKEHSFSVTEDIGQRGPKPIPASRIRSIK